MIRRAITAARTVLAIARDAALDLRDEARGCLAGVEYEECGPPANWRERDQGAPPLTPSAEDWRECAHSVAADLRAANERADAASDALTALAAARDRQARAAFAAGYAAACTGGMSAADQRRLRERMARWLETNRG